MNTFTLDTSGVCRAALLAGFDAYANDVYRFAPAGLSQPELRAWYRGYDTTREVREAQPPPAGEEFLEFKEALADLRSLRHEHECLNGGGPGWAARNKAAWAKADELFANEDEAAYDRQQEDHYG